VPQACEDEGAGAREMLNDHFRRLPSEDGDISRQARAQL
jgi:hypothetical protein